MAIRIPLPKLTAYPPPPFKEVSGVEAEVEMLRMELESARKNIRFLGERIEALENGRRDDRVSADILKEELRELIDRARG